MTPCYPEESKRDACLTCARWRSGAPAPAMHLQKFPGIGERTRAVRAGGFRATEVIDATAIRWPDGKCPMYAEREIVRHYTELEKESA